jgi:hypothetical protein
LIAETFRAETFRAQISNGRRWEFLVEAQSPHRVLRWSSSAGKTLLEEGRLIKTSRMAYWAQNGEGKQRLLAEFGLKPRLPKALG